METVIFKQMIRFDGALCPCIYICVANPWSLSLMCALDNHSFHMEVESMLGTCLPSACYSNGILLRYVAMHSVVCKSIVISFDLPSRPTVELFYQVSSMNFTYF